MKRVFKFVTLLFICFYTGYAQESTKKHTVRSGETLLSISELYHITPIELEKANPGVASGIKENDVLFIPESTSTISPSSSVITSISHTVKSGDTKFSLANRFGLTVSDLEIQNPEILSGLEIGQVLKIIPATTPSKPETVPNASNNSNKEGKYHVVQRGETLFGLSNSNGLTVDQLVKANSNIISGNLMEGQTIWIPGSGTNVSNQGQYVVQSGDTKFSLSRRFNLSIQELERKNPHIVKMLQVGQTLKVPFDELSNTQVYKNESNTSTVAPPKNDIKEVEKIVTVESTPSQTPDKTIRETITVAEVPLEEKLPESKSSNTLSEKPARSPSGYYDLRSSASTPEPKNILFFLPFSEQEYQSLMNSKDNFNTISDNFKRSHLEFYRGANIALDSIRKMNLKVNVDIIEAQSANQTSKVKSTIQDNNINNYDAVFLPFYKTIEEVIKEFTADSKTPVITATTLTNKSNAYNLYSAAPSVNQQRLEVLNYMKSKQAHIIVLSDINRSESKAFISAHIPNVEFVDIKKNGSFSENELLSKFNKDQLNFVVIDSDRNSVFLNATNTLLNQLTNYKLQLAVLEGSLIPDDTDVSQKRYRILKMIFPSSIPAKSTLSSKHFLSSYQKKHKLLPSANIMLGFDITFDSLLRLMQQQSFEYTVENYITEYTQLKFNYKKNSQGGYNNEGIYILQYDSDVNIRDAN